jgi:hypothetical protein
MGWVFVLEWVLVWFCLAYLQVYPQKVQCQKYQPEHRLTSSDHSPVVASFSISVDLPRYEVERVVQPGRLPLVCLMRESRTARFSSLPSKACKYCRKNRGRLCSFDSRYVFYIVFLPAVLTSRPTGCRSSAKRCLRSPPRPCLHPSGPVCLLPMAVQLAHSPEVVHILPNPTLPSTIRKKWLRVSLLDKNERCLATCIVALNKEYAYFFFFFF